MTKSTRTLLLGAALSGFVAGVGIIAVTQDTVANRSIKGRSGKKASRSKTDKHLCKGLNSCKGKGGCTTGDNGCAGKNSCKGKGGCSTVRWIRIRGSATPP